MSETTEASEYLYDIFIAHASADHAIAGELCHLLADKCKIYLDNKDLAPGVSWPVELDNAQRHSRLTVALISVSASSAWYLREEITRAIDFQRTQPLRHQFMPVLIDGSGLGYGISQVQAIKVEEPAGLRKVADQIMERVHALGGPWAARDLGADIVQAAMRGAVLAAHSLGAASHFGIRANEIEQFFSQEIRRFATILRGHCHVELHGHAFMLFIPAEGDDGPAGALKKALLFGLHLQMQARRCAKPIDTCVIVHWEEWAMLREVKANAYVSQHLIGVGLDLARRLMLLSDRPHVLLSRAAHKRLGEDDLKRENFADIREPAQLPTGFEILNLPGQASRYAMDEFSVHDRYKFAHPVYSLHVALANGETEVGDAAPPQHRVGLEYRSSQDVPMAQRTFTRILAEADHVTILGVTHETLPQYLHAAHEIRVEQHRGFWKKLQVVFPSERVVELTEDQARTKADRVEAWHRGQRSVFEFLLGFSREHQLEWDCLEFSGLLPFVGQRYMTADRKTIRIAPILPGGDVKESFYMEVFAGKAYDQLSNSFDFIIGKSKLFVEWNLRGTLKRERFQFDGLVSRRQIDECVKAEKAAGRHAPCFPVVLVMLHVRLGVPRRAVLQERTRYNAASDHGKLSNISGLMVDHDIFQALIAEVGTPRPSDDYLRKNYLSSPDPLTASLAFLHETRPHVTLNQPISPETMERAWRAAAVRELYDELGLRVRPEDLQLERTNCKFERSDMDPPRDLLFQIFSLDLSTSTDDGRDDTLLKFIQTARPNSALQLFTMDEMKKAHASGQRFNSLLQKKFKEIFLPIYKKLELV